MKTAILIALAICLFVASGVWATGSGSGFISGGGSGGVTGDGDALTDLDMNGNSIFDSVNGTFVDVSGITTHNNIETDGNKIIFDSLEDSDTYIELSTTDTIRFRANAGAKLDIDNSSIRANDEVILEQYARLDNDTPNYLCLKTATNGEDFCLSSTAANRVDIDATTGTELIYFLLPTIQYLDSSPDISPGVSGDLMSMTVGENVIVGQPLYASTNGKLHLADSSDTSKMPAIGMAFGTYSTDTTADIFMRGTAKNPGWSWTPGDMLYVSETAGEFTSTAPSSAGTVVQELCIAISATTILCNFDLATTVN